MDEVENVEEHIEELIRDDKDKELLSFLTSGGKQVCDFSPTKLLKLICKHNARYCLVELLEDEENFSLDVNMELEGGLFPLHLAAESLSFDIIEEFLERGAQANVCDERGSKDLTKLPLNLALQAISDRCVSNWSPEKSIYKLLYIFCLQDVEDPLSTATLLSEQTEDIENLALYYVEEGKVVQLAALLFCAWDRLIPPNVEDVEKSIVGQNIWTQVAHVYDQEFLVMTNCGPCCPVLETLKPTKINLAACWKFVKIFEIARGVINKYRNSRLFEAVDDEDVPYVVAHRLLEHTDLVLRTDDVISDDIESLKIQFTAKEKARVLEAIEKRMQSWAMQSECKTQDVADQSLACFPKESFATSMASSAALVNERAVGGGGRCCSLLSSASLSSCRSYHTWGDLNINFGKRVERHMPRSSQAKSLVLLPSAANICCRLVLCAKRFVK